MDLLSPALHRKVGQVIRFKIETEADREIKLAAFMSLAGHCSIAIDVAVGVDVPRPLVAAL